MFSASIGVKASRSMLRTFSVTLFWLEWPKVICDGAVSTAAGRADGPAAAEVTVDERQIRIKVYELASGEELESYSVSFNSK